LFAWLVGLVGHNRPVPTLRGKFIIASPTLLDPNFARAVVLIAEHNDDGAMGLVLNRPSEASVAESVEELNGVVEAGATVFVGGPVQTQAVMVLAEFDDPEQAAAVVLADVGFLPADADMAELSGRTRRARVFAGHAGWGPGQLDAELEDGSWIVEDPLPDEVFTEAPEDLWGAVLERKGGGFALLARMPEDPSLN
jgi:putative transcriptional regulator